MHNGNGNELGQSIVDNSTVTFRSTCTDWYVPNRTVVQIANNSNVSLYGASDSLTEICCIGKESGFQFINVTNLTLSQIEFVGCGTSVHYLKSFATQTISGVWFCHCENVRMTNITVRNSTGVGLALVNNAGYIEVIHSTFENNINHNINNSSLFGGGVYIRFDSHELKGVYKHQQRSCKLIFHGNTFTNNKHEYEAPVENNCKPPCHNQAQRFSLYESVEHSSKQLKRGGGMIFHFEDSYSQYAEKYIEVIDCLFTHNVADYGGGMSVNFSGNTTNNTMCIRNCNFTHNKAHYGGGISVTFVNNSSNNSILLSDLYVGENLATKGGGGILVGFYLPANKLTVQNCRIVGNEAQYGGGTVYKCRKTKLKIQNNPIKFVGCLWRENKAQFGAAVEASLQASNLYKSGYAPSPSFKDCEFLSNFRFTRLYISGNHTSFSWGKGVFLATALRILFEGRTSFCCSNTSALWASSSIIDFAAESSVDFRNNKGYEGGAAHLIGLSQLLVRDNSTFLFQNNTALVKGGAIIHISTNKLDFVSSKRCFFRYAGNTTTVGKRSIDITFDNNLAHMRGKTIFATTLWPCWRACKDQREDNDDMGCIGNVYMENRSQEVSTDGAVFELPDGHILSAIPGKEVTLNFRLLDEKDEEANGSYHVLVSDKSNISLDPAYTYIEGKTIKLFGEPGKKANVTVGTKDFRDIAVRFEVEMQQCPPGFVTHLQQKDNIECVCSAYTPDKTYYGIYHCALHNYTAYLIRGYWIGYDDGDKVSEETLRSGYCPRRFCIRKKSNDTQLALPANPSKLNWAICGKYREGQLCGSCSNNMSVFYHSNSYYCFENKYCELGLLLYLVSETIPVTILFITVTLFNVKFTSGKLNGFIFFIQFIDTMLIDANGFIATSEVADVFISTYQFLYRMFNLNFFTLDELSFCLWKGANTLDILAFKYVTIVYAITLVTLTVLFKKVACFRMRKSSTDSMKSTMIHGFSAFFVMCYSQCAKVTLFILTPGRVHSLGPRNNGNVTIVAFYKGDYQFLSRDHIRYVLPATLFGIAIVLIPPLLLVTYPLCYKVLALFRIEETRFIQIMCRVIPLEKLKPVFDSFQSCFKDRHRFFAGLYFLYRLAALLSFVVTDSLTKFYIALEVQLIVMLTLQATVRPYQRRWHNIIDALLFADLAIINTMTLHNYNRSQQPYYETSIDTVSALQTILILIPFVVMLCFTITQLVLLRTGRREREDQSRDELTETLILADYRHLENSKSL